eukprot:comp5117_c0_seq1/m.1192 comp5117_c0_seq1/g.1192  ORF comp5117_c0_seq1/g.1192 comp5117_c0_seq1/m.1192 type:complete len:390 (-) comp5117_c0_seq1:83-1252(-)
MPTSSEHSAVLEITSDSHRERTHGRSFPSSSSSEGCVCTSPLTLTAHNKINHSKLSNKMLPETPLSSSRPLFDSQAGALGNVQPQNSCFNSSCSETRYGSTTTNCAHHSSRENQVTEGWWESLRRCAWAVRPRPKSKWDCILFLWAAIYTVVVGYLICLGNSFADRHNINNFLSMEERKKRVLVDPLMEFLAPFFHTPGTSQLISDKLCHMSMGWLIFCPFTLQDRFLTVFRRMLYCGGVVYILRIMTVTMTILPNPWTECTAVFDPNIFLDAWNLFIGKRIACGDIFFSGHTIIFTLCILMWSTYNENRFLIYSTTTLGIIGMLSLVATTWHYSIDVFISFILTATTWYMFHLAVTTEELKNREWVRVLCYIDGQDVGWERMQDDGVV